MQLALQVNFAKKISFIYGKLATTIKHSGLLTKWYGSNHCIKKTDVKQRIKIHNN